MESGRFSKKWIIAFVSLAVLLLTIPIGVYLARKQTQLKSQASGGVASAQHSFDSVPSGGGWGISRAEKLSIDPNRIEGSGSLKIDYDGGEPVKVANDFPTKTNVVTRVYFYDDGGPKGLAFGVKNDNCTNSATPTNYLSIGLRTEGGGGGSTYQVRADGAYRNTPIPRGVNGWNLLEIITTPGGSYAKVNNSLLSYQEGSSWKVSKNSGLTAIRCVELVATWNIAGVSFFDTLSVTEASTDSLQDQNLALLERFYQIYGGGNSATGINLSPIFTHQSNNVINNIHYFRSTFGTVSSFYTYGKDRNDTTAKTKAKNLYLQAFPYVEQFIDYPHGGDVTSNSQKGIAVGTFMVASHVLWNDLPPDKQQEINRLVGKFIRLFYLSPDKMPYSNPLPDGVDRNNIGNDIRQNTMAEENSWQAATLAIAGNLFPQAFTSAQLATIDNKARCFAFHTITALPGESTGNVPGCTVTTATVPSDYKLHNHGQPNGIYASATVSMLGTGAFAYRLAGKPIPVEFYHNLDNLYSRFLRSFIDRNTYRFIVDGVDKNREDWTGATSSLYDNPLSIMYLNDLRQIGVSAFNEVNDSYLQDFAQKRSVFYKDMLSEWVEGFSGSVTGENQESWAAKPYRPGQMQDFYNYSWFMDSSIAWINLVPSVVFAGGPPAASTPGAPGNFRAVCAGANANLSWTAPANTPSGQQYQIVYNGHTYTTTGLSYALPLDDNTRGLNAGIGVAPVNTAYFARATLNCPGLTATTPNPVVVSNVTALSVNGQNISLSGGIESLTLSGARNAARTIDVPVIIRVNGADVTRIMRMRYLPILYTISGSIFRDDNKDGIKQDNEPVWIDSSHPVTLKLHSRAGRADDLTTVLETSTPTDGTYSFSQTRGNYSIEVSMTGANTPSYILPSDQHLIVLVQNRNYGIPIQLQATSSARGTISVSPTSCVLPDSQSSCQVTVTWSTNDAASVKVLQGGVEVGNGASGSRVVNVSGSTTFNLLHRTDGVLLDRVSVAVSATPLTLSCVAAPGTSVPRLAEVTWTANVSGGMGGYTYLWQVEDTSFELAPAGNKVNPLVGKYHVPGVKPAIQLTVSSGSETKTVSCDPITVNIDPSPADNSGSPSSLAVTAVQIQGNSLDLLGTRAVNITLDGNPGQPGILFLRVGIQKGDVASDIMQRTIKFRYQPPGGGSGDFLPPDQPLGGESQQSPGSTSSETSNEDRQKEGRQSRPGNLDSNNSPAGLPGASRQISE